MLKKYQEILLLLLALIPVFWMGYFLYPNGKMDTSMISKKYTDTPYASDSLSQKLDIFLPEKWDGPYPVIVAIHWGGFSMGSKESDDLTPMLKGIRYGFAVVTVNYRLTQEAPFPAALLDIQKSLQYLRKNAQKYNINPNTIVLWGDSAGGNLAALAGVIWKKEENTQVSAVVDWFWPIDFSTMDSEFQALWITPSMWKTSSPDSFASKYIWKTIGTKEAQELVKRSNPSTFISSNTPPFLIEHGTNDTNVPITQSENFSKKLELVLWKDTVHFIPIEWAGHGGDSFETQNNLNIVFSFIDKYTSK